MLFFLESNVPDAAAMSGAINRACQFSLGRRAPRLGPLRCKSETACVKCDARPEGVDHGWHGQTRVDLSGSAGLAVGVALFSHGQAGTPQHLAACLAVPPGVGTACLAVPPGVGTACLAVPPGVGTAYLAVPPGVGTACLAVPPGVGTACLAVPPGVGTACLAVPPGFRRSSVP